MKKLIRFFVFDKYFLTPSILKLIHFVIFQAVQSVKFGYFFIQGLKKFNPTRFDGKEDRKDSDPSNGPDKYVEIRIIQKYTRIVVVGVPKVDQVEGSNQCDSQHHGGRDTLSPECVVLQADHMATIPKLNKKFLLFKN